MFFKGGLGFRGEFMVCIEFRVYRGGGLYRDLGLTERVKQVQELQGVKGNSGV